LFGCLGDDLHLNRVAVRHEKDIVFHGNYSGWQDDVDLRARKELLLTSNGKHCRAGEFILTP
jgi:hypothetical protein